jgi:hypothetical protein
MLCVVKSVVQLGFRKTGKKFSLDSAPLISNGIKQDHCALEGIKVSTLFSSVTRRLNVISLLIAGLLPLAVSGISVAAPDGTDEVRSSISRHQATGGRDNPVITSESDDEYDPLATFGSRSKTHTPSGTGKPGSAMTNTPSGTGKSGSGTASAQSASLDFWIFDADVDLFNDDDRDGFYHGIDLLFDADTIYSAAEVYAVVYLSLDFGPWNEYGVTEDFWIFGASGTDEYVLVTELMSGYPTGDYDLLIELFDATDDSFLTSFGPDESSALSFLPLEDFNRDEPIADMPVAISHGGGGAADVWTISVLLLLLVASAARKIWRRRNDALYRIDTPASCWTVPTQAQRLSLRQRWSD